MAQTALKLATVGMICALSESIAGMHTISGGTVEISGGTTTRVGTMMIVGPTNTKQHLKLHFSAVIVGLSHADSGFFRKHQSPRFLFFLHGSFSCGICPRVFARVSLAS
jgi:hypothetical protein